MTDYNIDQETAEAEFQRFIDENEIDADEQYMDAEDLKAFNKQKRRLVRAIRDGSLVIDEEGRPVYTPQVAASTTHNPLTFRQRSGASLMASDMKKSGHDVGKTYAIMADMTQREAKVFAGLVGRDIKVCEAIFVFLMD